MAKAAVINLKKRQMTFEGKDLRVIVPLDPSQGEIGVVVVNDLNNFEVCYSTDAINIYWDIRESS